MARRGSKRVEEGDVPRVGDRVGYADLECLKRALAQEL
jgi:hypothetical protein